MEFTNAWFQGGSPVLGTVVVAKLQVTCWLMPLSAFGCCAEELNVALFASLLIRWLMAAVERGLPERSKVRVAMFHGWKATLLRRWLQYREMGQHSQVGRRHRHRSAETMAR